MRSQVPRDPLVGCVVSTPTRWPGRVKLEACASAAQFDRLRQMPGVWSYTNERNRVDDGWYVPQSLLDFGRLGANLHDYLPDPVEYTPCGLQLRPYQRRGVSFLRQITPLREGGILAADMGLGKAEPDATPVPVPAGGTKRLGDLVPGDFVFGADGRPTRVESVHRQGRCEAYKLRFSDGATATCNIEHLWHVRRRGSDQYETLPLGAFIDTLCEVRESPLEFMPQGVVQFDSRPETDTPIDPYLIGLLLGGADLQHENPVLVDPPEDVRRRLWAKLPPGVLAAKVRGGSPTAWTLGSVWNDTCFIDGLRDALHILGTTPETKFIPDAYLFASPEIRLTLLQGIADMASEVTPDGRGILIETSALQLSRDVTRLVRSLGGSATWQATGASSPARRRQAAEYDADQTYQVEIRMPAALCPVSAERHLAKWAAVQVDPAPRTLKSVEHVGTTWMTCIRVEAPDGLYLTNDFIVTHNTTTALQAQYLDGFLERPGIVCGPKPAKNAWCGERSDPWRFFGLRIGSLVGRKNIDPAELETHKWWFCHYDILVAWQPWLFAMLQPACVIFDESHLLMHGKAERSKSALQVSMIGSVDRRILLTGTPIPNNRLELWSQLACAQPRQWGSSKHTFGVRYCAGERKAEEEGGNWDYKGESNTMELQARLAGTFLRYTRNEVAGELPELKRHVIAAQELDAELMAEYHEARRDVVSYLRRKGTLADKSTSITIGGTQVKLTKNDFTPGAVRLVCLSSMIGVLSRMKKAPALAATVQILQDHDKLVIFTWRIDTAKWLYKRLRDMASEGPIAGKQVEIFGPVSGKMPQEERQRLAYAFADARHSVYVATRGSAGIAINELAAASAALFVDLYWNTASLTQAESRVHRDGNPHACVDIYYLVARDTIDAMMLDKLEEKASTMANLAGGDTIGLSLVHDLAPTNSSTNGSDIDALCDALMDMED